MISFRLVSTGNTSDIPIFFKVVISSLDIIPPNKTLKLTLKLM